MKLHVLSDLHLAIRPIEAPTIDADVTVIAGDLGTPDEAIAWARAFERPVVLIPVWLDGLLERTCPLPAIRKTGQYQTRQPSRLELAEMVVALEREKAELEQVHTEMLPDAQFGRELKAADPVRFFEDAGVGLSDGADFGTPGWVRLNFGCPRVTLELALQRMASACTKLRA